MGFRRAAPDSQQGQHKFQFVSKADREKDEIQRLREQMTDMRHRLEGKVQPSLHRISHVPSQQHSDEERDSTSSR